MAERADDLLIGQEFNGYRIERRLAAGGMGAVYRVRHTELADLVKVLKVILPVVPADEREPTASRNAAERVRAWMVSRFELEAAAVARLNHPHIVPIDWIGTVDGHRCILMPFLVGKSLAQLLDERGGHLAPHDALHVAAQVANAMEYAHRRGIIHRDLKPANIFVVPTEDDPLHVKVIDFGVAKLMDSDASKTGAFQMGTPLYMSIEQFSDSSSVTALADLYSLAVVVWKLVTGVVPWEGAWEAEGSEGLYHRRFQERFDPPPVGTMPDGWERILRSAFAVELRARPQSMRELIYALASGLPGGIEILRNVVRRWVESSPGDESARGLSAPGPSASGPSVSRMPTPETLDQAPSTLNERPRPLAPSPAAPMPSASADGAPRPSASSRPELTTLGSSAGVLVAPSIGRRKLALLGVATALLASVCVLLLAGAVRRLRTGDSVPAAMVAPSPGPSSAAAGGSSSASAPESVPSSPVPAGSAASTPDPLASSSAVAKVGGPVAPSSRSAETSNSTPRMSATRDTARSAAATGRPGSAGAMRSPTAGVTSAAKSAASSTSSASARNMPAAHQESDQKFDRNAVGE